MKEGPCVLMSALAYLPHFVTRFVDRLARLVPRPRPCSDRQEENQQ